MKAWKVSTASVICGSCRVSVPSLSPFIELDEPRRVRCAACAKRMFAEDVPSVLPPAIAPIVHTVTPPSFERPAKWAQETRVDFRQRAAGGDE